MRHAYLVLPILLFATVGFAQAKKDPVDLWFLAAELVSEGRADERAELIDQIRLVFVTEAITGTEEVFKERLAWFQGLPDAERREVGVKVVPQILKWRLRHRIDAMLKVAIDPKFEPGDRLVDRDFRESSGEKKKEGFSFPLKPEDIFEQFFKEGKGASTKAGKELLEIPHDRIAVPDFETRHSILFSQGLLRCHRALDEKDYPTLVAQMEWTWTYLGPETDGAAIGRDWSRPFAILYWDVARHVGFDPEDYLKGSGFGPAPGSLECGTERTLLSFLGGNGMLKDRFDGLKSVGIMLMRIPGHEGRETDVERRPLKASEEAIRRCYDGVLGTLEAATSKYGAEPAMTILARHPDKAYHDRIRSFLQSPHPEVSAFAARLLGERGRQYPADHATPRIQLSVNGKPLIQESVWIRQGQATSGSATATSRTSDGEGAITFRRWDRTFLNPEGCIVTLARGPLRLVPLEVTPKSLWGANLPLTELLKTRTVDFQMRPVEMRLSLPESRKADLMEGDLQAQMILFAGQENHGLGSSPDHKHVFPLALDPSQRRFPDLPDGKHRLLITCKNCFPISKFIEVTKDQPTVFQAALAPAHQVKIRFLDVAGTELPRQNRSHVLIHEDPAGGSTTRGFRETTVFGPLAPGEHILTYRLPTGDHGESISFVIGKDDPALLSQPIEFRVLDR